MKKAKIARENYDNIDRKKEFPRWFREVFLYHYKVPLIVGAALLLTLSFLIYDTVRTVRPDIDYVTATYSDMEGAPIEELRQLIEGTTGDLNRDGKLLANNQFCQLGSTVSVDMTQGYYYKLLASFNDANVVMYIMDKQVLDLYTKKGNDTPFGPIPIERFSGTDALYLSLDDSVVMKNTEFKGDKGLYIAFKRQPTTSTVSSEEYYAPYIRILEALFNRKAVG